MAGMSGIIIKTDLRPVYLLDGQKGLFHKWVNKKGEVEPFALVEMEDGMMEYVSIFRMAFADSHSRIMAAFAEVTKEEPHGRD